MKSYVPLHVHTEFSLLDGALKIKDYLNFAKAQGWPAAAITDHGNVFGGVKFFQEAKNSGVKPILGCEMYTIDDVFAPVDKGERYYHLTMIVQNQEGYTNLCKIMEFAYSKGFYFKPRVDYQRLREFSKGLIVGSGCLGGHISKLFKAGKVQEADERIKWFLDVFGSERFFLEVMPAEGSDEQQALNQFMLEKGKEFGIKVVATSDSHYLKKEHKTAHETLLCIGTKDTLSNPDRYSFGEFNAHLKSTQEMLDAFPNNPEVVYNSGEFAQTCEFKFEFGKFMFPTFVTPPGLTSEEFFRLQCVEGLEELFSKGLIPQESRELYEARLKLEIDLIIKMGFVGYFLVVGDFIAWSKKNSIPVGPGRGSAAGSLVAWALKITNIDPIAYNLLFERFLNPERVSLPDIDIDFCINGRERVIDYVKEKYGHDSVCQIITFGTLMAKGVIKDVSRVLGLNFKDSTAITDLIPEQLKITLAEALKTEPKLEGLIKANTQVAQIFEIANVLEGITRHASKHAAGVVISPQPLKEVLPLFIPEKTDELVTQYAMVELESLGYLKMDFLGLKNLTVIDLAVQSVLKRTGKVIDLDKIPMNDKKVYQMLSDGKTCGVFQFEGDGVTQVMKRLKPTKFEDLIAVNALYRPGPLSSGMVDDFIDGRHGLKKPVYMFKELEDVLSETYGVIVYQEQVMKISSVIAGYSLGGADILRRAMGKKKADVMEQQRESFVQGAIKNGKDKETSSKLFDLMAFFSGYGFNKSHSAAYALIAYQTAYLKANYPSDFEAAILSSETHDPEKLREYLEKTRQAGVHVLPPDINQSFAQFSALNDNTVLFGLQGIKNIGDAALQEIINTREKGKFLDIYDFCKRVNQRVVNKRAIESLIKSGAMDCLAGTRAQKLADLEEIMSLTSQEKEFSAKGQRGLFGLAKKNVKTETEYKFKTSLDFDLSEKLAFEKEIIGFYLSSHPLDRFKSLANWITTQPFFTNDPETGALVPSYKKGEQIQFLAILDSMRIIKTKSGHTMASAVFSTKDLIFQAVVFPGKFTVLEKQLVVDRIFVVQGVVDEMTKDEGKIKLENILWSDEFFTTDFSNKSIRLSLGEDFSEQVKLLKAVETESPEGFKIVASYRENGKLLKVSPKRKFALTLDLLEKLEEMGVTVEIAVTFQVDKRPFTNGQNWKK